jgi:hypothetical protein
MLFREATVNDIKEIQIVRNSVKENMLSNPKLVTDKDCEEFLTVRGKGWVCETDGKIVGFSIADLQGKNIWALFLKPEFEKKGIGKKLYDLMLDWYFGQTTETVWLSTSPGTRAETFYRRSGWKETGIHGKNEIKFEMTKERWVQFRKLRIGMCAGEGNINELKRLFDFEFNQAEINVALENAIAYSQIETAEYLLSLGADLSSNNYNGVYYAVHNDELEGLKFAIAKGVDINIGSGVLLNESIVTSTNVKSAHLTKWLLENGADLTLLSKLSIDLVDKYGNDELKSLIKK